MKQIDLWVSIFFSLVFLVMAGRWILRRRKYRRAAAWPVEMAHLESSRVVLSDGGGQPGAAAYYVELRYSYAVQGCPYLGFVRRRFLRKESAESWVQRFRDSDTLALRYNPNTPADSVLREEDQLVEMKSHS